MHIQSLHVYPIKSCAGVDASSIKIGSHGPAFDRQWMLVDDRGNFVTQRKFPQMAQIRPWLDDRFLSVSYPGFEDLRVSLQVDKSDKRSVRIWKEQTEAIDQGLEASGWFSEVLKHRVSLVKNLNMAQQQLKIAQDSDRTNLNFYDEAPVLLTSQDSLDVLNSLMHQNYPMDRFRPNIVLGGMRPFAEDLFEQLQIGGVLFEVGALCYRCSLIDVEQATGQRSPGLLKQLVRHRKFKQGVAFGVYLTPLREGVVFLDDVVLSKSQGSV